MLFGGSAQDVGNPQVVNHSALIYGVSASSNRILHLPRDFNPTQIVQDVVTGCPDVRISR